jgi:HrpJ-like domain
LTTGPSGIKPASVLPRALAVAACAVLLAGCNGGTVDRHALTNDTASIDSMACEGALLAHDVAEGKTTVYFAREQAEELRIQSSNLADALAKRKALASIERKVRAKSRDAAKLSAALQRLRDHPSNRGVAASVEQQLKKLGGCA